MRPCYLLNHVIGVYSGLLYAPAGEEVYLIRREESLAIVMRKDGLRFWTQINNLSQNTPHDIPTYPTIEKNGKKMPMPKIRI